NICSMAHASESLKLVDKYLLLVHANDPAVDAQFRKEQMDGAGLATAERPTVVSMIMQTISIEDSTYREAVRNAEETSFEDVLRKASLMLLTGDAMTAATLAQKASALAQGNTQNMNLTD